VYGIVWLEWSPRNIWIGHDGVVYLFMWVFLCVIFPDLRQVVPLDEK
jgi:hypothetical protein